MALHLLNCVVDAPDATGGFIPEELTYNDMESLVEVVAEQVFGFEDYFPEYDDVDSEEQGALKVKKNFDHLPFPKDQLCVCVGACLEQVDRGSFQDAHFVKNHFLSTLSPPPWS